MAKLSQLQWIPMIVKAYNDAKARTTTQTSMIPRDSDMLDPSTVKNVGRTNATSYNTRTKVSARHRRPVTERSMSITQTSANERVQKGANKRLQAKRSSPHIRISALQYQAMLRELRETKNKLTNLETIQERLTRIQDQLQELDDLRLHLVKPDSTAEEANENVTKKSTITYRLPQQAGSREPGTTSNVPPSV